MDQIERLTETLELLVRYHSSGLPILLGEKPRPKDQEWLPLLEASHSVEDLGIRIDHDVNKDSILDQVATFDNMERFIDDIGWKNVTEAAKAIKSFYPKDWDMFTWHVMFVTERTKNSSCPLPFEALGSKVNEKSPLEKVADHFCVSPKTVSRRRRIIPMQIARLALQQFQMTINW